MGFQLGKLQQLNFIYNFNKTFKTIKKLSKQFKT